MNNSSPEKSGKTMESGNIKKSTKTVNDAFYELFVYENLEHIIHKYRLKEQELQKMEEEKNGAVDWAAEEEKMEKKAEELEA